MFFSLQFILFEHKSASNCRIIQFSENGFTQVWHIAGKAECDMDTPMTAIEMTGTVDENHQLQLDGLLPFAGPKRVRVIVLSPLMEISDEVSEVEWLKASLNNPAFEYLRDPEEDIYTIQDGKPFYET